MVRLPVPPIGTRFERLVVTGAPERNTQGVLSVRCLCDCGTERVFEIGKLSRGNSRSCGCLVRDKLSARNRSHGGSRTPLYYVWSGMKARCQNPQHREYHRYGGRGIDICREWAESFETFRDWALSSGYAEGLEIDREDNDAGYSPSNCRWIGRSAQLRNTRYSRMLTAFGETKSMRDWADDPRCVVSYNVLNRRISSLGWDHVRAITEPMAQSKSHKRS